MFLVLMTAAPILSLQKLRIVNIKTQKTCKNVLWLLSNSASGVRVGLQSNEVPEALSGSRAQWFASPVLRFLEFLGSGPFEHISGMGQFACQVVPIQSWGISSWQGPYMEGGPIELLPETLAFRVDTDVGMRCALPRACCVRGWDAGD